MFEIYYGIRFKLKIFNIFVIRGLEKLKKFSHIFLNHFMMMKKVHFLISLQPQ